MRERMKLDLKKMESEIRRRDYSPKTLSTYLAWVWKFSVFTEYLPESSILEKHAKAFLTDLAVEKKVVASTQNLLAANYDIHTIQKLLGHTDVKTTMIYTHTVKSRTNKEPISPLDLD
jgi:hypothetical protein